MAPGEIMNFFWLLALYLRFFMCWACNFKGLDHISWTGYVLGFVSCQISDFDEFLFRSKIDRIQYRNFDIISRKLWNLTNFYFIDFNSVLVYSNKFNEISTLISKKFSDFTQKPMNLLRKIWLRNELSKSRLWERISKVWRALICFLNFPYLTSMYTNFELFLWLLNGQKYFHDSNIFINNLRGFQPSIFYLN